MTVGSGPELGAAPWEANAGWWAQTFTGGADPEYERQIIPLILDHIEGARRVLDLGCGEGQVARRIEARGRVAFGVDPAPSQLANAMRATADATGSARYTLGQGEELPFRSGAFDAVVCCLVIEHVADADRLMGEVARVLGPGGRFVLLINHPMFQGPGSGLVDDRILGEMYWRVGPYLHQEVAVEEVDPGVEIPFAHRPLSGYLNPLADRGLFLTRMEEPPPPRDLVGYTQSGEIESLFPRLMLLRLERR
jgi:SAM-dependent methyltransferase